MARLGVTALIELPPAGTLTGLARRALAGIQLLALKTPEDLAAGRVLLAEHADAHADGNDAPDWRLVVAPLAGMFRAPGGTAAAPGTAVPAGGEVGQVEARGGDHAIAPVTAGTIIEWLVEDGDPVSAGQPLLRLQPASPPG